MCLDLLLLDLDRCNHLFLDQRDDMLSMGFALIETQIPLVLVITDQTIDGKLAQFTDAQADWHRRMVTIRKIVVGKALRCALS